MDNNHHLPVPDLNVNVTQLCDNTLIRFMRNEVSPAHYYAPTHMHSCAHTLTHNQ